MHVLGTPPAFTLSQDQTLQFFSEVLKFRLSFYDFPKDVGTASDSRPPRCGFGAGLEVLRESELAPGTLLASSRPPTFRSSESSSKDSRKLFNPHLLSQTRTDVSVQFSRNRRRPAAGRRILAEALFGVKRKVKPRFTFSCFSRSFDQKAAKTGQSQRTRPRRQTRGIER